MSQKLMQSLGLHHVPERKAWCCIDHRGDIEEVVKIHQINEPCEGTIVSMGRKQLAQYAAASCQLVVRMFDVTRFRSQDFDGWGDLQESRFVAGKTIKGTLAVQQGTGSYSRGIQVADIAIDKAALVKSLQQHGSGERKYATFVALDWRHNEVGEYSCDPDELANYFVASDQPFQTSPAFFRPEVLSKYKADSEKYTIDGRTISCRSAWYLKSWGVNDAGQVHAYLGDLGDLPEEEQLHWKQFNEEPKVGLSANVIRTDFYGQWCDEYEPLASLKHRCQALDAEKSTWWRLRDANLPRRTNYPHSDSRDDWGSEILNLDQLVVESLDEKSLRKIAQSTGREPDKTLRALKLAEECLVGFGYEETRAREIMSPFHDVHNLRSEVKGHASASKPREREREAREKFGSLVKHFEDLCARCDESLELVAKELAGQASAMES